MAVRLFFQSPSPALAHLPAPLVFDSPLQATMIANSGRSFRNLQPRTRLIFGFGAMAWAGIGLLLSDKAEEVWDLKPTEKDRQELDHVLPRVRRVD